MAAIVHSQLSVLLSLTTAIGKSRKVDEIYEAALDALTVGTGVERSSILLFDADGVMRFEAWRGLSDAYRQAVDGHTPWRPDSPDPQPIAVPDVHRDAALAAFAPVFEREGIVGLTFIPLVSQDRVIGKFMLYHAVPRALDADELALAGVIAAQVAFAVVRTRTEAQALRSEERLRFALDAASMGTWDWDLAANSVQWSDNLERIHGLPEGAFDGTFASYEREIHPDDRPRVLASVQRALAEGVPHDVEYRLVAPDGTVRWCEGKGRVEYQDGRPVRMTGVCVMVTRRKEAELARLAAAEETSRLKDEFLATLSHELRTPLSAILGWVHMLEIGGLTPELTTRAVDVIGRNARLQAQLVEDVLDVSRIIVGKLDIERTPLALRPLLDGVVAGIAPALSARRIQFTSRVPSDLAPVEGDRRRLQQVLNNVFSNALKFTPEGGSIALECTSDKDWVEIRVRDSGIGIDPEFLPLVFDRFRQADSRSTRRHGGLGLGLAITRHLVEQHGGEIRAESEGRGRGTTIVLRMPSAAAAVGGAVASGGGAGESGDLRLDAVTILVVDDQPDSREISARLLELRGAVVRQSESAAAALDAIAAEGPDLLIADIAMPDVDGYELIRRVRARGWQMPAIAVTAIARADDRDRALAAGYNAYCAKPVDGVLLARTVRQLVPAAR